jgi:hypothetical protein
MLNNYLYDIYFYIILVWTWCIMHPSSFPPLVAPTSPGPSPPMPPPPARAGPPLPRASPGFPFPHPPKHSTGNGSQWDYARKVMKAKWRQRKKDK